MFGLDKEIVNPQTSIRSDLTTRSRRRSTDASAHSMRGPGRRAQVDRMLAERRAKRAEAWFRALTLMAPPLSGPN